MLLLAASLAGPVAGLALPTPPGRRPAPGLAADAAGLVSPTSKLKEESAGPAVSLAIRSRLKEALRPLVGAALAPRVAELARAGDVSRQHLIGEFEFEERAVRLMAGEQWFEAHDVLAAELKGEDGGRTTHAHAAELAARLLEGICQHELACTSGLDGALAAHEERVGVPHPCGCVVPPEAIEPFADLARVLAALAVPT